MARAILFHDVAVAPLTDLRPAFDLRTGVLTTLDRLAPRDRPYVHDVEGPDDMPAHIKTALTATSLSIPVTGGQMLLGTWQGVYVAEHRDRPHRREVVLHYLGTFGG